MSENDDEVRKPKGKSRKPKGKIRRMVFTDKNVLSLPARRNGYMKWDGGYGRGSGEVVRGLGIWVSPLSAKSYRSMFYFPGSTKSHTRKLGRVGDLTLAEAREQCRQDRAKASKGIDPRVDRSRSASFKAAVDDYVKRVQIGQKKLVRAEECCRVLLADTEDWHDVAIGTIDAKQIQERLDLVRDGDETLGKKSRPHLANLLYARMKPFFAWCAKPNIGKIQFSPMVGIDKPYDGENRRVRDWFEGTPADQVITQLWSAADKLGGVEGQYLKILLLTGKRKTALADMQWSQIEQTAKGWFWKAPPGTKKIKNKRLHPVPLSSLIQRILSPRQQTGFVFPGNKGGRIDVGEKLTRAIIKAGANEDFFLHGVRHIAETKLAELKVPAHIRDLLFDHVSGRGAGKIYDHHAYEDEMRAALEKWADHIGRLVQPEGIALLR